VGGWGARPPTTGTHTSATHQAPDEGPSHPCLEHHTLSSTAPDTCQPILQVLLWGGSEQCRFSHTSTHAAGPTLLTEDINSTPHLDTTTKRC
jgi:hypothetical protein